MAYGRYPAHRPRRLRGKALLLEAVADVTVAPKDLILPMFVSDKPGAVAVASMPGVSQLPVAEALQRIRSLSQRGLKQFLLFGVTPPQAKDEQGSYAWNPDAPVNRLLSEVRQAGLDVLLYADLCLCEYTEHGHCGVLGESGQEAGWPSGQVPTGHVRNDATLENLGKAAVVQARCGADVVAPSGMMDGMVGAIRTALDRDGFQDTAILSYAIKYASSFYGPFREASEGGMKFGDRRGYQMDYRRSREWRTELEADIEQGADMVMVKPAMAYLDIVQQVRQSCWLPVAAYHVSGEFAMLHAAAQRGWLDLKQTVLESTFAIKRAGADLIVTYFAADLMDWM